jgi:alanine-glyoxylate transaminase/serine-glyoxylate transaminase/serine-pyruvate transaminase
LLRCALAWRGWRRRARLCTFARTPPPCPLLNTPKQQNNNQPTNTTQNNPKTDPWFAAWFKEILDESKLIYGTERGTPFIFSGTGTGGWESALTNTLSPGDKVLTFRYGQFSHLWVDMMERLGLDVTVVDRPWGEGACEQTVEKVLSADKAHKYKAVCVVHNETTTGVTSDIAGVRAAMDAAGHPAMLMVDGVSSIGALDFRFDDWRVDVAVTGSQKALSLPTGLALVCASDKALEAGKTAKLPRVYYSFEDQLKTNPSGNVPYTPSLMLLHGLKESLALLREEGMANVTARHARLAEGTRAAVAGWGLQLLCKQPRWRSDSLTVIEVPQGVDSNLIVKNAYARCVVVC